MEVKPQVQHKYLIIRCKQGSAPHLGDSLLTKIPSFMINLEATQWVVFLWEGPE